MKQYILKVLRKISTWVCFNGLMFAIVGIVAAENKLNILVMAFMLIYSVMLFPEFFRLITSKTARILSICLYPIVFILTLTYSMSYTDGALRIMMLLNGLAVLVILYRILRFIWNTLSSVFSDSSSTHKPPAPASNRWFQDASVAKSSSRPVETTKISSKSTTNKPPEPKKEPVTRVKNSRYYYCEYCGFRAVTTKLLLSSTCTKHPEGSHKGRHKLYEGTEKDKYFCKYCGQKIYINKVYDACAMHSAS